MKKLQPPPPLRLERWLKLKLQQIQPQKWLNNIFVHKYVLCV
jgi:hypothetical protein